MNKMFIRTVSAVLAATLPAASGMTAFAAESSPKEEVIYIMTDGSAEVQNVYAVNIYSNGDITDYGDFSEIKMLNTNDGVTVNGDEISFHTDSEKAYLQGKMENCEIPWNISICYILDGKELSAEEVAGKSGNLEIHFIVEKNKSCKSDFYENYALQASFTLDTELCANITAEDATTANVGKNKQLTYTILPDKGIDTIITADVHDFEMDAVQINGIRMNLNIDIDYSELTDKATTLSDSISALDDGEKTISDGAGELKDGGDKLKDGSGRLKDGTESLDNGITKLSDGIEQIGSGLSALQSKSSSLTEGSEQVKSALNQIQSALSSVSADTEKLKKLTEASGKISTSITELKKGAETLQNSTGYTQYKALMSQNGLDIDQLYAGNSQAIETLDSQLSDLSNTLAQIQDVPGFEEQAAQLSAQIDSLSDIAELLSGNNAMISGTQQYIDSLSDGISELYDGISELETSYNEFNDAISELADTLATMLVNVSKLSEAIDTLAEQYNALDNGIVSYTDGVGEIVKGYSQLTSGMQNLSFGSKTLVNGSKELDSGVTNLQSGLNELNDGTSKLSDGTRELKDKTSGMDTQIEEKIDNVIDSIEGGSDDVVSFVSDKNDQVKSVQFVIKTSAIEIPEIEAAAEEPEEHLSFWQKLLRLFGLY